MRVVFAFLAEAATFNAEGRFNVLGGDVTVLRFPSFPGAFTNIALVMKIEFSENEANRHYIFRAQLLDDQEIPISGQVEQVFYPHPPLVEGTLPIEGFVVNFPALAFTHPGIFTFRASIDDGISENVRLHVLQEVGEAEQG